MTSYRPIDSKREEFRKYLEKAGAMDALTKVLVMLYDEPEKPADALEYIKKHLGDNKADEAEIEILKTDLEAALLKIQTLEDEVNVLKEKLTKYEPEESVPTEEVLGSDEAVSAAAPAEAGTEATTAPPDDAPPAQ